MAITLRTLDHGDVVLDSPFFLKATPTGGTVLGYSGDGASGDLSVSGGVAAVANGGTGRTTLTPGALLYASGTNSTGLLAPAAAGKVVISVGAAPAYSAWTLPASFPKGSVPYASAAEQVSALLSPSAAGILTHPGGTGVPAWSASPTFGGNTATSAAITLNAAAGTTRRINFQTASVLRWYTGVDSVAETGANAGTNYVIARRDDAGASLGDALTINRATGLVSISGAVTLSGILTAAGDTDVTHVLGRSKVFSSTTDNAMFAHFDMATNSNYAVRQSAAGATQVNAATGQSIVLSINANAVATWSATGLSTALQLTSTLATGTAPLAVTSTTMVTNLNAELLGGQNSAYHLALANASGNLAYARMPTGTGAWDVGSGNTGRIARRTAIGSQTSGEILILGDQTLTAANALTSGVGQEIYADGNNIFTALFYANRDTGTSAGLAFLWSLKASAGASPEKRAMEMRIQKSGTWDGTAANQNLNYTQRLIKDGTLTDTFYITSKASFGFGGNSYGGGVGVMFFADRTTAPSSAPTGGFLMSGNAGVPTFRTSGNKIINLDQGAAVTAPTGGSVVDVESRAAISTLITRLQDRGLLA